MRRQPWIASLLVVGLSGACSGSEDDPLENADAIRDGSVQSDGAAAPDGALPGDADGSVPMGDAGVDAGPGSSGDFTVTVLGNGQPLDMVRVFFHDGEGNTERELATNASGLVSWPTAPLGGLTVVNVEDLGNGNNLIHAYTFLDVADEDHLTIDLLRPYDSTEVGTLALDVPSVTDASAEGYEFAAGTQQGSGFCRASQSLDDDLVDPLPLPLAASCVKPSNAVLGYLTDGEGFLRGYTYASTPVARPPQGGTTNVTLGEFTPYSSVMLTAQNVPAFFGPAQMRGEIAMLASGGLFYAGRLNTSDNLAEGAPFPYAAGFGDLEVTGGGYDYDSINDRTLGVGVRQRLAETSAVSLDFDLPLFATFGADATDVERPTLNWSLAAPLAGADAQLISYQWTEVVNSDFFDHYNWTFVTAPERTSLRIPSVESSPEAGLVPVVTILSPNDEGQLSTVVALDDVALDGYAAFKRQPLVQLPHGSDVEVFRQLSVRLTPSTTHGTVRITLGFPGGG